ncbi:MAG: metallophosphoesterase family protein [Kiloniellales bacterium]
MAHPLTRRNLLGAMAASAGLAACSSPSPVAWNAQGASKGPLRLVFYTDVHARTEWETPLAMAQAAEAINARRADLVIAGGDLITDGFQNSAATVAPRWDAYMSMQRSIRPEVHAAIGNHDLVAAIPADGTPPAADPKAIFRERMGLERTYRSFDALGYHFVLLDSVEVTGGKLKYNGRISAEQLDWLRGDLARLAPATPIVAVLHIPLLTTFYAITRGNAEPAPANRVVVNNKEALDLFRDYNLVLVLQGHLHVKELIRWREATFITGGAVCAKWWRGPWYGTQEGFNVVTLHEDRVEWEYVDTGWEARRPTNAALPQDDTQLAALWASGGTCGECC